MTHHLPAGSAASGPYLVDVTPRTAGWGHASLRVIRLPPGGSHSFDSGGSEWIVLPLSGGCTVTTGPATGGPAADPADTAPGNVTPAETSGTAPAVAAPGPGAPPVAARPGPAAGAGPDARRTFRLTGRDSVFDGVSDFAYVPRDARTTVASEGGGRFALAGARCARRLPARRGPAHRVPVELRGSGSCSRQVNNFAAADAFPCDRLIAVEVLTPGGNWSSFPPHKHDRHRPGEESRLEEVYYFEFAAHDGVPGLGYQRVSPSGAGGGTDVLAEVRDGDVVLVPDGWHGPSMAVPGHHMYYLNVMAGPVDERAWRIRDHPDHAWVRDTWPGTPADPRLPLYSAPERPA
ncbi:5-deoxy-glucuronate isomerase [Streptomyces sp. SHP 1-2]|uniref:5-deoxy-glucuronate isomerase n=1 Tax=Streptomyces sp. SHP 1-2 TaxID=2769489 RepID=UPI002238B381|nr:5-deoxy-glucuronate isomerase [Streptomyces sp. SHP 1-2]MCW5250417.1 5-deoxy-glucuronate isomerase [Streptomyces sp. SHP 1-2]